MGLSPETDLAAVRFDRLTEYDMDGFDLDWCVGNESAYFPHVGDPVTFMSLFTEAPGRTQIFPVARFGHISRLPEEQILVQVGSGKDSQRLIDAYLV